MKAAAVYFEAVSSYELRDIETAIGNFLNGSAPGVNPNFAPPAPAVAGEVRRCMNLRLDAESRRYAPRNQLPPPTIERTDESRARVAAMMREAVDQLGTAMRTDDAEAAKRKQAHDSKLFARFDPPQTEDAMRKRLGFSVADSDIEGDMGGRAA